MLSVIGQSVTDEPRTVTDEPRTVTDEPRPVKADSLPFGFDLTHNIYIRIKKGKQKNYTNYTLNPTQTLHFSDFPCVTECIVCAPNYTQTIHKLYIEPYIESHRDKESKSQRVKESKRQRVKKTKRLRAKDERTAFLRH